MRIVLDLQGAQTTGSRQRGIGRYSLSLAKAIAREPRGHEILIALNGSFPGSIEPIRAAFDQLLPQENIRVWQVGGPVGGGDSSNDIRRHAAELAREAFLASLSPDVVHISSLFEGFGEDAVTSIGAFASQLPTAVTLYDLIPYLYQDTYLTDDAARRAYGQKLEYLRQANMLVAISESSRREALDALGLQTDSVVNISSAAEDSFRALEMADDAVEAVRTKYGLTRPFVMYTGGIDHRKNIEGLLGAYAALPLALRKAHQLAIVCAVLPNQKRDLERLAQQCGLTGSDIVITGFVPESDLVALYNLCKLFVFPSWHEGFGLPVLEAMRCGAPVIGANTSSLPEVIGREDALFDPHSTTSISSKMQVVLTDEALRNELIQHGLRQAETFSWSITAQRALDAFERLHITQPICDVSIPSTSEHPVLAYVSPLPPERSGIASYSTHLIRELVRHYQIVVVVREEDISDPWINANCIIRSPAWLEEHAHEVDRVLYQFGNSEFHEYMFGLMETIPGTVVLHDFFLSDLQADREWRGICPDAWARALYYSHGYGAVKDRYHITDTSKVIKKYPANLSVLRSAQGVIVHSDAVRRMSTAWYGEDIVHNWRVIPLLRESAIFEDKQAVRKQLGLTEDSLVVCSFGFIAPTKLNDRLLSAWLASSLSRNPNCVLFFVGENHPGEFGESLSQQIRSSGVADRIRIVGWTDSNVYRRYLAAADIGVQLRASSRGETSAAVLDCLNYGLATIVNANGSMADLRKDSVWMLPDIFTDEDLVAALEALADNPYERRNRGKQGYELIKEYHNPRYCADRYHLAIESFWAKGKLGFPGLINALSDGEFPIQERSVIQDVATMVAANSPPLGLKQLLVDISELIGGRGTFGVEMLARNILSELIGHPPVGYKVEPVFTAKGKTGYFYARNFVADLLNFDSSWMSDDPIDAYEGDVFLGLSYSPAIVLLQESFLNSLRDRGVKVCFVAYGLPPVTDSNVPISDAPAGDYTRWFNAICQYDKVIAISKIFASEIENWLNEHGLQRLRPLQISWFYSGETGNNDTPFNNSKLSKDDIEDLPLAPSFLMVGALEPSELQEVIVEAFEQLWADGVDVSLTVIGGNERLTGNLLARLSAHSERGRRLLWIERIEDDQLRQLYLTSDCLILASAMSGLGLPFIEVAKRELPMIAMDIPVFRELDRGHAFYFEGQDLEGVVQTLRSWLDIYAWEQNSGSMNTPLAWTRRAKSLVQAIFDHKNDITWI